MINTHTTVFCLKLLDSLEPWSSHHDTLVQSFQNVRRWCLDTTAGGKEQFKYWTEAASVGALLCAIKRVRHHLMAAIHGSNSNGCGPALAINPSPSHRALRRAGRPRQSATENYRLRIYLSRLSIERQARYLPRYMPVYRKRQRGATRGVRVTRRVCISWRLTGNPPACHCYCHCRCCAPLFAKPRWEMGLEAKHGDGQTELISHPHTIHPKWTASRQELFKDWHAAWPLGQCSNALSSLRPKYGPSPGVIDRESMTRRTGFHLLRIRLQPVRVAVLWTDLQVSPYNNFPCSCMLPGAALCVHLEVICNYGAMPSLQSRRAALE